MADTQSWPATEQWPSQQWPGTRTTTTPERERIFVRQGSLHTAFLENSPRYEVEDGGLAEEAVLQGLCLFLMGLGCFALPEAILLQTPMFSKCFGWGNDFYGLGLLSLFLPGLAMQFIQNRCDATWDARFGSAHATVCRIIVGNIMGAAGATAFLLLLYLYPVESGMDMPTLIVALVMLGIGSATVYGSSSQVNSMFPSRLHPAFFCGTFCVSLSMAPINLLVGALWVPDDDGMGCSSVRWGAVTLYYSLAFVLTVAGLLSSCALCLFVPSAVRKFIDKDSSLRIRAFSATMESGEQRRLGTIADEAAAETVSTFSINNDSLEGGLAPHTLPKVGAGAGAGTAYPASPTTAPSALSPSPSSPPRTPPKSKSARGFGGEGQVEALSTMAILWQSSMAGTVMFLSLVESLLVCAQYTRLRSRGDLPDLSTIMYYSYYASQCIGTVLNMSSWVKRLTPLWLLMIVTILRLAGVLSICCYVQDVDVWMFSSDWMVLVVYTVYMVVGGYIFSNAYSAGSSMFKCVKQRSIAATILNVQYYLGICISSLLLLTKSLDTVIVDVFHARHNNGSSVSVGL